MLLKIGFNNQPLNPFVQIKFSKFSSIDSTWDHFTFNSNLINPTITKRNLESLMINETHRSNINKTSPFDYGNANSRNKLKCLSSPPPINVYPGWKNWTSGVRERERERGQILAIISSLILLNMKNGIILPLEASSSNTLTRRR